ncbi:MAG TPA: hypothetical protein VFC24_00620 [Casimicrobiaceae bacterium]|nr:hypothetical protein [Casimicrobiaceae bacterium]
MSIDAVNGAGNAAFAATQAASSPFRQMRQDFAALGAALNSGDVAGAQSAFATYQKDLDAVQQVRAARQAQGASGTQDTTSQGGSASFQDALKTLGTALSSGDVAGAQQAFQSLQQQMAGGHGHGHGHHHHAVQAAQ